MYVKVMLAILAALGVTIVVLLAWRPAVGPSGFVEAPNPLDAAVAELRLKDVQLQNAVQTLRQKTGVNVIVRWHELEKHGLTPLTPVSADLHDITLLAALKVLFVSDKTAAGGGGPPILFEPEGGVVTVTDTASGAVVRVYDVRDLLSDAYHSATPATGPSGGAPTPAEQAALLELRTSRIIGLLGDAVVGVRSINGWGGRLVILAAPESHRTIEELLRRLREAQ